ncbi:MAG: mercury methylation corrinoid protein HgcA [Candidatus Aquicultorales bacterium]
METAIGKICQVTSRLTWADTLGHWRVRWGIKRYDYRVDPGLYALGRPSADSPVLVTANYKLTFDVLRSSLPGIDAWILVLDTRGINVWCAAGKATFSTDELVGRVKFDRLGELVSHRRVIVPQLGATGVAARSVRKLSGFSVTWGPVRAADLPKFLADGMRATAEMRQPTFTVRERLVLTPIELVGALKPTAMLAAGFIILGLMFARPITLETLFMSSVRAVLPLLLAVIGGAIITPLLLPWLPPRSFAAKGAIVGSVSAPATVYAFGFSLLPGVATFLAMTAVTSYVAMNFTGTTPFTSLSGVEKEMRRWIPLQAAAVFFALISLLAGGLV